MEKREKLMTSIGIVAVVLLLSMLTAIIVYKTYLDDDLFIEIPSVHSSFIGKTVFTNSIHSHKMSIPVRLYHES
jgi:hypothetical protein